MSWRKLIAPFCIAYYRVTDSSYAYRLKVFWYANVRKKRIAMQSVPGVATFSCDKCGWSIRTVSNLHYATEKPSGKLGYQCQQCFKFISRKWPIEDTGVCDACGGALSRERVIRCPECRSSSISTSDEEMT